MLHEKSGLSEITAIVFPFSHTGGRPQAVLHVHVSVFALNLISFDNKSEAMLQMSGHKADVMKALTELVPPKCRKAF